MYVPKLFFLHQEKKINVCVFKFHERPIKRKPKINNIIRKLFYDKLSLLFHFHM